MRFIRLAAALMLLSVTLAQREQKTTIKIDGEEYDLDEKICLIKYKIYKDKKCT